MLNYKGIPINHYILLSAALFTIGVLGVLYRRNAIIILMSIELMLNAVNLLLVAFSTFRSDASAQVFVFFYHGCGCSRSSGRLGYLNDDLPKCANY